MYLYLYNYIYINFYVSELQVNGQLFESPSKTIHTALFSAMAVMCGADIIIATKYSTYCTNIILAQLTNPFDISTCSISSLYNSKLML